MRIKAMLLTAALILGLLSGCAAAPVSIPAEPQPRQEDPKALADARVRYRDASLIVSGECIREHTDAAGETCYDLEIAEILAGSAGLGDVVHCKSGDLVPGSRYLLYLGESSADVHHAEDTAGYSLLTAHPMVDSDVIWEGTPLSYDALKADMEQLAEVISAPTPLYYYGNLRALSEAAEEIFIGRVAELPAMEERTFVMRSGGAAEKLEYPAAMVTVQALGSVKGVLRYGETIELVHCPARVGELVNGDTLQPFMAHEGRAPALREGGYYLFFLTGSGDRKQEYYFTVNPIQGCVPVEGEAVITDHAGLPLSVYHELTPLVQAIQRAMRNEQEEVVPPPLIVG